MLHIRCVLSHSVADGAECGSEEEGDLFERVFEPAHEEDVTSFVAGETSLVGSDRRSSFADA